MNTLFPSEKGERVREYCAQTTGTDEWHKNWLGLVYTDGIQYVAETCKAHWLIDLVASWQPDIARKHQADACFQVWRLEHIKGDEWLIEAWSDTPRSEGSTRLARQKIPYSDFPEDLAPFEFWVEGGTMLLKQEH